jgi:hypothetical protein
MATEATNAAAFVQTLADSGMPLLAAFVGRHKLTEPEARVVELSDFLEDLAEE